MKTILEAYRILVSIGLSAGLQFLIKYQASIPSFIQALLLIGFILLFLLVTYCISSFDGRVYCAVVAVPFVIIWGKQFFQLLMHS